MSLSPDGTTYHNQFFESRQSALLKEREIRRGTVRQNIQDIDEAAKRAGYPGVLQPEIDFAVALSVAKKEALCRAYEWEGTALNEEVVASVESAAITLLQESLAGLVTGEKGRIALKAQRTGKSDLRETEKIAELSRHVQRTIYDTQKDIHSGLILRMLEAKRIRAKGIPSMTVGELASRIEKFHAELSKHFDLWQQSLEQPLPDQPVRNITKLSQQCGSLSRQLGVLRPYIVRLGLPTAMGTGYGAEWEAYNSAVSNDIAVRKGPSIDAILPQLQQALGMLEGRDPRSEFELRKDNVQSPHHVTIHQHGPQARVNLNSTDYSHNVLTVQEQNVFAQVRAALEHGVSDQNELKAILSKLQDFESSIHQPTALAKFQTFVNNAASYMTLLAPFIPALTAMLSQ